MQNQEMTRTMIRAAVTPDEKANTKARADELGLTESELIRAGLKKMGVKIEVEKMRGAPLNNNFNPKGNPKLYESSSKFQKGRKQ